MRTEEPLARPAGTGPVSAGLYGPGPQLRPTRPPAMTYITKLSLQSGDRAALEDAVATITETARRKGAALKGPHSRPPRELRVRLPQRWDATAEYPAWEYTVYERDLEIVGHDDLARRLATDDYPRAVHVSVEVERVTAAGGG